jgi:hypothetical protein
MLKLLAAVTSIGTILLALPAIAQDSNFPPSAFEESDARNGVIVDRSGFRSSSISVGSPNYHKPHFRHKSNFHKRHYQDGYRDGFGHRSIVQPRVIISPNPVVNPVIIPHRSRISYPAHPRRGLIIAPTIKFGGGFDSTLCTTTNTITSRDGTVFQSSTTQPCNF